MIHFLITLPQNATSLTTLPRAPTAKQASDWLLDVHGVSYAQAVQGMNLSPADITNIRNFHLFSNVPDGWVSLVKQVRSHTGMELSMAASTLYAVRILNQAVQADPLDFFNKQLSSLVESAAMYDLVVTTDHLHCPVVRLAD